MVDVTHYADDRRTGHQFAFIIFFLTEKFTDHVFLFFRFGDDLVVHRDLLRFFKRDLMIYGQHFAGQEHFLDDGGCLDVHLLRKVADRDALRKTDLGHDLLLGLRLVFRSVLLQRLRQPVHLPAAARALIRTLHAAAVVLRTVLVLILRFTASLRAAGDLIRIIMDNDRPSGCLSGPFSRRSGTLRRSAGLRAVSSGRRADRPAVARRTLLRTASRTSVCTEIVSALRTRGAVGTVGTIGARTAFSPLLLTFGSPIVRLSGLLARTLIVSFAFRRTAYFRLRCRSLGRFLFRRRRFFSRFRRYFGLYGLRLLLRSRDCSLRKMRRNRFRRFFGGRFNLHRRCGYDFFSNARGGSYDSRSSGGIGRSGRGGNIRSGLWSLRHLLRGRRFRFFRPGRSRRTRRKDRALRRQNTARVIGMDNAYDLLFRSLRLAGRRAAGCGRRLFRRFRSLGLSVEFSQTDDLGVRYERHGRFAGYSA